jgi:hypothetical protein
MTIPVESVLTIDHEPFRVWLNEQPDGAEWPTCESFKCVFSSYLYDLTGERWTVVRWYAAHILYGESGIRSGAHEFTMPKWADTFLAWYDHLGSGHQRSKLECLSALDDMRARGMLT